VTTPIESPGPVLRARRIFESMKQESREVDLGHAELEVRGDADELKSLRGGRWVWMEAAPDERQAKLVGAGKLHLFGTRGAVSALTFGRDGELSFRRRFTRTRRERITDANASFRDQSNRSLWTGLGLIDSYGMHENHATAVYPLPGGRLLMQSEGSRPMLVNDDPDGANDLAPIGALGNYSDSDPTAPWYRTPYTSKPIGRLLLPDIAGSRWPTTNGPTHPGIDLENGHAFFPVRRDYARPARVDSAAARARVRRFGLIYAYLHTVVWDWRDDRMVRVPIRDRNGRQVRVRWGLHQSIVDSEYLIVIDSGFPAEHRQFGPVGPEARAKAARFRRPRSWGPGYTGVLPHKTRIHMIRKKDLVARLDTAWTSGCRRVSAVQADQFEVDGSCIHAYTGSEPGSMALLMTTTFDPSEWITYEDKHPGGEPVHASMRGFGHGDWATGHVQYVEWTKERGRRLVNEPKEQTLIPGGQFAAEPYDDPIQTLHCTSQGVWPELLTQRVMDLYPDPPPSGPLRTSRLALHSAGGVRSTYDMPWGFPFGSAESEKHLMVGVKYAEEDRVVDRLLFFRRDDLARGPVAEVRSKKQGALNIRLGLHGHFRRPA
jgi:hypothetical protein